MSNILLIGNSARNMRWPKQFLAPNKNPDYSLS